MRNQFNRVADMLTRAMGSPFALAAAALIIVGWATSGPIFQFSDTWQLVINTGTTIVTFLMVFVIQNSQNRDSKALHLKLDELIRAVGNARNDFVLVEQSSEEELQARADEMAVVAEDVTNEAGHPEASAAARRAAREIARKTAPAVPAGARSNGKGTNGNGTNHKRTDGKGTNRRPSGSATPKRSGRATGSRSAD